MGQTLSSPYRGGGVRLHKEYFVLILILILILITLRVSLGGAEWPGITVHYKQ